MVLGNFLGRPISHDLQLLIQNLPDLTNSNDSVAWTMRASGKYTSASAKEAIRREHSITGREIPTPCGAQTPT